MSFLMKLTLVFTFLSFIFIQKNNAKDIFEISKSKDLPIEYSLLYYKTDTNKLDLNIVSKEFKKSCLIALMCTFVSSRERIC